MIYQTIYIVPWDEAHIMNVFDKCDTMHVIKEDTDGRTYRTELMYVNLKGEKDETKS